MLRQLTASISDLCFDIPLHKLHMTIAGILSLYDIRPARLPGDHPDIRDKVDQFLSAKRLEGLSELTLDGYQLELRIFAEYVSKPIEDITTGDIRAFLASFEHLKMSSISKKLSVLKSFFGWLADEEIISKDPTRRIKPPKKKAYAQGVTIGNWNDPEACKTSASVRLSKCICTGGRLPRFMP